MRPEIAENMVEQLRKELEVAKHERSTLRRRLVEARKWVGFCPILQEGMQELGLVRDLIDDTLDEVKE